jgi:hypothetical protein
MGAFSGGLTANWRQLILRGALLRFQQHHTRFSLGPENLLAQCWLRHSEPRGPAPEMQLFRT